MGTLKFPHSTGSSLSEEEEEEERPFYADVVKRVREKHGERGVRVLQVVAVLLGAPMVVSILLIVYGYGDSTAVTYVFVGFLVLLIFSPFIVAFALDAYALVAPKRYGLWKAGVKSKAFRLPEFRDKYQARKHLSSLEPYEFEQAVAEIYRGYGYEVEVTQQSGDYGVDLRMEDKRGTKYAVQVKRFRSSSVGRPTLQRLQGALLHAEADVPIVVTLSYFTEKAKLYAEQHGIRLVDGEELLRMYNPK